jgi:signal transduction histidine kinase
MRISTQFKISLAFFAIALIIGSVSLISTSQQIAATRTQENLVNKIAKNAGDLAYLSNDYVIYHTEQQFSQWQAGYVSFSNNTANLTVDDPDQKAIVQDILANQQRMKTAFDSIVLLTGNNQSVTSSTLEISWSSMSILSQTVISDANHLTLLLRSQVDQLNLYNFAVAAGIIGIFAVFIIVVYVQTFRHTLKSVSELRSGVAIIGSGDLDFKLKETRKDEIAELSHAFNEMAKNLKIKTKQLKDSERFAAIGATAGMVGHDIRNPLQAIVNELYFAKKGLDKLSNSKEKESTLERLEEIETNIDYINKIVQDLQDYARPLNPKLEEVEIQSIIERVVAKTVAVDCNIKTTIRVEEQARLISSDSFYLNRILYNLITNSIQAMPNGGELKIDVARENGDITIAVSDTGVGIPQDVQSKMFTIMFTTKSKGQGFGLPVVKRMTESLGGTVAFDSQEGKGTTFTIRLPTKS